ncbi:hypothetical protein ACWCPM_07430 [Streptomyces sp. NPDC002309]
MPDAPEVPECRPGVFVVDLHGAMIGTVTLEQRDEGRPGRVHQRAAEAEIGSLFLPDARGHGYVEREPTGAGASVERTRSFLEEHQTARGRVLCDDELQLCWAAGLWVRAVNAKTFHLDNFDALGRDEAETRMRHAGI